jgi:hypothetical protein
MKMQKVVIRISAVFLAFVMVFYPLAQVFAAPDVVTDYFRILSPKGDIYRKDTNITGMTIWPHPDEQVYNQGYYKLSLSSASGKYLVQDYWNVCPPGQECYLEFPFGATFNFGEDYGINLEAWICYEEFNCGVTQNINASFTIHESSGGDGEIPGPGVGISPNGTEESNPVTFTWQADPYAVEYWLWLDIGQVHHWDMRVDANAAGCSNGVGTCSYTLNHNLLEGDYAWWVLPVNAQDASSGWSPALYFSMDESNGGGGGIPGVGVGISPDNTDESNPVTFVWQADPDAAEFWLWIQNDSTAEVWDDYISVDQAGCVSGTGTCTFTLPENFIDGSYIWWVMPLNSQGGFSGWSSALHFTVSDGGGGGGIPGVGVGISPDNTDESNPVTFVWQADPDAAEFWLWIQNDSTAEVWDDFISADQASCAAGTGTCTFTLPENFVDDSYTWWVLPMNSQGGFSGWSSALHFTVSDGGGGGGIPGVGVGISPDNTDESNPVTFVWQADPDAASYMLWLEDPTSLVWDEVISAGDSGCSSGSGNCSYTLPFNLNDGAYIWWVLPMNSQGGFSGWSSALNFTVDGGGGGLTPGNVVLIRPVNITVVNAVTFSWEQYAPMPTNFVLTIEPGGYYEDLTWYEAMCTMTGETAFCSYALPYRLDDGDYLWQLQPVKEGVYGAKTPQTAFTVNDGGGGYDQLPGQGVGISPNGTNENNPVTLTWQPDPYADRYWLWVEGSSLDWEDFVDAAQAGCADGTGTCSFTLPVNLSDDAHTWWVLPANNLGYGVWSAGLTFTIGTQPQPDPPTIISPVGTYNIADPDVDYPDIEWTPVPGTQTYITNLMGRIEYTPAELGCADEVRSCKTSLNVFIPMDQEFTFTVEALSDYPVQINDQYSFDVQASSTFKFVQQYEICQPGKGKPISPNNVSVTDPVTFTWQADTCKFGVQIAVGGTNWTKQLFAGSDYECSGDPEVCSYTLTDISLAPGNYTWAIVPFTRGKSGLMYGEWSDDIPFEVSNTSQLPGQGVGVSPNGTQEESPVTYVWQADPFATRYELWVQGDNGYIFDQWFNAADVGCGSSGAANCSYTINDSLADGSYLWYVLPANDLGYGSWSFPLSFTVSSQPPLPGQTIALQPSQSVKNPVIFEWEQHNPLPSHFTIVFENLGGGVLAQRIPFADANCVSVGGPATCHYSMPNEIGVGDYEWYVQPENEQGLGEHSNTLVFSVYEAVLLPGQGQPISPDNVEVTNPVTFTWYADPLASAYRIYVKPALVGAAVVVEKIVSVEEAVYMEGGTYSYVLEDFIVCK